MVRCPLTNSENVRLIEKMDANKIVSLYDLFGIDTREALGETKQVYKYLSLESGYGFFLPITIQGEANLYETLEKFDWYYQEEKWEHIKSLELITPSDKVLEVGCGQGSFLAALKKKYGNEPVGLELNQHAVDKAVAAGLKVYKEEMDHFSATNRDVFDVICFFQVVEHIANPVQFLQHAMRMLKKGGRIIISVPDNDSLINKDDENALNYPPHHMGLWNRQSLNFLGKILSLEVLVMQNEPLQTYHIDWYVRTLLKKIVGKQIYYRVISKTGIPGFVKKRIVAQASKIHGHSILAVYKK